MRDADSALFANLTALSPPAERTAAAAVARRQTSAVPHTIANDDLEIAASAMELDDTLESCRSANSVQCSADPAAFAGFHSHFGDQSNSDNSSIAQHCVVGTHDRQQQPMRLALNLGAHSTDMRSASVSVSQLSQDTSYSQEQFASLFCGDDTQDELAVHLSAATAASDSTPQPRLTFVKRSDAAKRAALDLAQTLTTLSSDAAAAAADGPFPEQVPGPARAPANVSSDEEVASAAPTHAALPMLVHDADVVVIDSDDDDDSVATMTTHTVDTTDSVAIELARLEAVQWFSADDDMDERATRRDSIDSIADTQSIGDSDDDVAADIDADSGDTLPIEDATTASSSSSSDDSELALLHDDNGNNTADEESPSHVGALSSADLLARTMSPVPDAQGKVAPSPARAAALKRRTPDKAVTTAKSSSSDDSGKLRDSPAAAVAKLSSASRSLALSFALPDSQDSASQSHDARAATHRPPRSRSSPEKQPQGRLKRTAAAAATESLASTVSTDSTSSSSESTPTRRKRARSAPSPDVGASSSLASTPSRTNSSTPSRRSARSSNASTAATPPTGTSLSGVRTRARGTPPVPTHRTVVSPRMRSLLKHRFEFCVTGFVDASEAYVITMIQDHGGRVVDRPSDLLVRGNTKAVVIATPVAWRKLKFLYAIACGIPVVHPEWLRASIRAERIVPFDGYVVPSGYSVLTRKFECLRVQPLDIFANKRVGIAYDVRDASVRSARGLGAITAFILRTCGAARVIEDLTPSRECDVDVVLSDEMTKTCEYYRRRHGVPVKSFSWVTECIVLQRYLSPHTKGFEPQALDDQFLLAANAAIGDVDRTMLKLHPGELVLADLAKLDIDSFLIFHVCEILRITIDDNDVVMLEIGVLKRRVCIAPNSPKLMREHTQVRWIPASHVKKRVVAVAEKDFKALEYRDETMFYYEDTDDDNDDGVEALVSSSSDSEEDEMAASDTEVASDSDSSV